MLVGLLYFEAYPLFYDLNFRGLNQKGKRTEEGMLDKGSNIFSKIGNLQLEMVYVSQKGLNGIRGHGKVFYPGAHLACCSLHFTLHVALTSRVVYQSTVANKQIGFWTPLPGYEHVVYSFLHEKVFGRATIAIIVLFNGSDHI